MSHPYDTLKLKVGDEVWIRAKITQLDAPGTLGYSRAWVSVAIASNGLLGEQTATVEPKNIGREGSASEGRVL